MQKILKEETLSTQNFVFVCLHHQVFFVYPSSLYLECSSPVHIFLSHPMFYVVYGQTCEIFFQIFVVQ